MRPTSCLRLEPVSASELVPRPLQPKGHGHRPRPRIVRDDTRLSSTPAASLRTRRRTSNCSCRSAILRRAGAIRTCSTRNTPASSKDGEVIITIDTAGHGEPRVAAVRWETQEVADCLLGVADFGISQLDKGGDVQYEYKFERSTSALESICLDLSAM